MRTLVPPQQQQLSSSPQSPRLSLPPLTAVLGLDDGWGIRRVVRLSFPNPSALAHDPEHTARLSVYLTDLLRPYGLTLEPGAMSRSGRHGGQSYGEMAEALIAAAVPEGEQIDLLVMAYHVPDITPGRATTTYLSHICPGTPLSFAVSDQGAGVGLTALRLVQEYARTAGLRRALLLLVEQCALPYDPGVPVTVPSEDSGVALLFGDIRPAETAQSHARDST